MTTSTPTSGDTVSLLRGLVAAAAMGTAASTASADLTADVAAVFDAGVTGGTYGFMLKEVDGPVLTAVNEEYLFYPASSIKVVQHVHAMLMVEQDDEIDLNSSVFVYVNPEDQCDDDHTGQEYLDQTLSETLTLMMVNSGNGNTNAIQDYFGRANINATMQNVVGLSDETELNHKFGACGGPQPNANQFPLVDASLLYERVARGQVFSDAQTRDDFYSLMLHWDNSGYFNNLFAQERPEHMSDDAYDDFRAGVRFARKGGSWSGGIRSDMGWIELPPPPCNDGTPREFTFGSFVDFADSLEEDFGLQATIYEMLRDEVRALMMEWTACTNCGTGGACDTPHEEPGCDTGSCCEIVCATDPSCCTSAWDETCVGLAFNLCNLFETHDDCANAEPVGDDDVATISVENASSDGPGHEGECGWDTEFIKDVWYTYTAGKDGHLEIQSLAGFPTWVAVYDTDQCPVTENDLIDCRSFEADAVNEYFETCAIDGDTYLIRVGAANTETQTGTLHVKNKVGHANFGYEENPNGIGLANEIIADDFQLPCDDNPFDDLNISVMNFGPDGPPSSLQWFLYEPNAAGSGPGTQIAGGAAVDMQIAPIEAGTAGGPDNLFDIRFDLGPSIELLEAGRTYWFGILSPGVMPLASTEQTGAPAQSLSLGSWQSAGGDFAFSIAQGETPCPGDTNGDGSVNVDDLVNVMLDWNTAAPAHGGDVNGNGMVDVDDLVLVIVNFGDCP